MKYRTLTGASTRILDQEVTKALNEGWSLYGNQYFADVRFHQVVVLYEEFQGQTVEQAIHKAVTAVPIEGVLVDG